ncbi:GDSL-type esterase/lipase family protein [Paenibacillus segetis]|uniref:SGNH hydrolase-type esterase domain-containing protein n=1 Tax=Paenibacillus segetis TaxID=1325360 RepID=A0ABQ1YQS8_9BACL|nr:GDSL-type esterase/lipase family protein [Paenibacillus segetis]GGH35243.1 hypothetical protein GCM10008013_41450 [Paenibacillus segetis]
MEQWVSTWGQAHTEIKYYSPNYKDSTMRLAIANNLNGEKLRLRVSNIEGKKPLHIVQSMVDNVQNQQQCILFRGKKEVVLLPGEEKYSDPVIMPVRSGEFLTVSMAFQGSVISGNSIEECVQCSKKGNYVEHSQFKTVHRSKSACYHDMQQSIPALSSIEVFTVEQAETIICFGDSITQQSFWTKPFCDELYRNKPGEVSVVNKGIGGNRLLKGSPGGLLKLLGKAGIERFERDVLGEAGVKTVILAIGINDFGMGGKPGQKDWTSAEQLIEGYVNILKRAKNKNIKSVGTTLLPRGGSLGYRPEQERERQKFNDWVRSTDMFDKIIDFDYILRDPRNTEQMNFVYDSGDHLHPGPVGGKRMAMQVLQELYGINN